MRKKTLNRRELLLKGGAVTALTVGANLALARESEKGDRLAPTVKLEAEPYEFVFQPASTALMIIDMQRDFVMPGGFGELLGNDVKRVRPAIEPTRQVLKAWRENRLQVLHTREGHRADLSDCPPSKKARGKLRVGIGDKGPMGRNRLEGQELSTKQLRIRSRACVIRLSFCSTRAAIRTENESTSPADHPGNGVVSVKVLSSLADYDSTADVVYRVLSVRLQNLDRPTRGWGRRNRRLGGRRGCSALFFGSPLFNPSTLDVGSGPQNRQALSPPAGIKVMGCQWT
jgi:hypothetical protein